MAQDFDIGAATTPATSHSSPPAAAPLTGAAAFLPQTALDAADAKIATWSTAIVDAADAIERLLSSQSLPVPDQVRDLATSTTQKLRTFGTTAGETDAADLVTGLQRRAAAHPAASIGIGAAVGAALATLLVRLGSNDPSAASGGSSKGKTKGTDKPASKSGSAAS